MTDRERDELIRKAATGEIDRIAATKRLSSVMPLRDAINAIAAYRQQRADNIGKGRR
ncbi:hypothetical protein ACJ41P_10740 [Azospirillum argentinense]|uniref:Uncharacterized protein n=1 Tax=Azospirillum argentinense TaxID=2970906 RepID=A0ABW8V8M8_9PROT